MLGTAEVFADNASQSLLPMLVRRDDLALANSRIQAGFITVNQMAGPPLGAALFAAGMAWPFVGQAILVATGAVSGEPGCASARTLATAERVDRDPSRHRRGVPVGPASRRGADPGPDHLHLQHHLRRGLVGARPLRHAAAGTRGDRLRTAHHGLGGGGILGTLAYGWITRRVSLGNIMRVGLIIETLTHLGLAITTPPRSRAAIFFVFGAHAFVWGTTSVTVRQRAVPTELQGRVGASIPSACSAASSSAPASAASLPRRFGVTAPFWFAFAGSALFLVLIWRQLAHIAHDDEPREPVIDGA